MSAQFVIGAVGVTADLTNSPYPLTGGELDTSGARSATIKNFSLSPVGYKHGDCEKGFDVLDPATSTLEPNLYFNAIDGVKPPAWGGDWFKVQDHVDVDVDASGNATHVTALPIAMLEFLGYGFCYSDPLPASPTPQQLLDYRRCTGRKAEPDWSTPAGKGHTDWLYPRPAGPSPCAPKAASRRRSTFDAAAARACGGRGMSRDRLGLQSASDRVSAAASGRL